VRRRQRCGLLLAEVKVNGGLRRAGSESRGLVGQRFPGWLLGVGFGRWCSPRLAPEATRNLPGVQAAAARVV
jgi:hypothetical protein